MGGDSFKDVTGKNADPTISLLTYTTGPFGDANGAISGSGAQDSYLEWDNSNGAMETLDEVTFVAW